MGIDDYPCVEVKTRAEWRVWLERNHDAHGPIWLATWKKDTPHYLGYDDIVEEALCFGWIDSTARALDTQRSMLMMAPRKPRSVWSGRNKARVEKLEASGLMTPAGRAKVEAARLDGSWTALDAVERLEVPEDLDGELRGAPGARACFDAYPPSLRKQALYWIDTAKRDATRAKRIAEIVHHAARNERPARWAR